MPGKRKRTCTCTQNEEEQECDLCTRPKETYICNCPRFCKEPRSVSRSTYFKHKAHPDNVISANNRSAPSAGNGDSLLGTTLSEEHSSQPLAESGLDDHEPPEFPLEDSLDENLHVPGPRSQTEPLEPPPTPEPPSVEEILDADENSLAHQAALQEEEERVNRAREAAERTATAAALGAAGNTLENDGDGHEDGGNTLALHQQYTHPYNLSERRSHRSQGIRQKLVKRSRVRHEPSKRNQVSVNPQRKNYDLTQSQSRHEICMSVNTWINIRGRR